ncbi:MAG: alpha-hydroxy acid oxidase, partial [Longimicrobiales bacterium]
MGFQRLAHPDGELAMARAAAGAGTIMVASTLSTHTIEAIVAAADGSPVWLQLYVFRDRALTAELVARASDAGCTAVCLTVDVPVQGNREHDARNRFALPDGLEIANFTAHRQRDLPRVDASGLGAFIATEFDPSLDWSALAWIRSISPLPVIVKGVLTGEDARLAIEHGADAVIVSNHGGRQLDGALASLDALADVAAAVGDDMPLLMDGGVRRGTDVLKAVALGARAVLVGRPLLWALALAGEAGVTHALGLLRAEIERDLALLGRPRVAEIGRDAVVKAGG